MTIALKRPIDVNNPIQRLRLPVDHVQGCNCGITALSVLTQQNFSYAFERYKQYFGKTRNWKGGTKIPLLEGYLLAEGKKWKYNEKFYSMYGGNLVRHAGGMTFERWANTKTKKNILYMVWTRGHIQCILNGFVVDQKGVVPVDQYRFKTKRVLEAWGFQP